jgi:2'-5' RNA ligase
LLHWQTANLGSDVRWQHRDDLHMTLHFLGAVDESRVDDLRVLGGAAAATSFSLLLDHVGYWRRPKVLWAAPTAAPDALRDLRHRLGTGLEAAGMPVETREYRPHVTLARRVLVNPDPVAMTPIPWAVRHLALVESRPGSAPHYRIVAGWQLTQVC